MQCAPGGELSSRALPAVNLVFIRSMWILYSILDLVPVGTYNLPVPVGGTLFEYRYREQEIANAHFISTTPALALLGSYTVVLYMYA